MRGFVAGLLIAIAVTPVQAGQDKGNASMNSTRQRQDFQVIEFRRYIIRDGEREHFAEYFESWFPEAFRQLGAIAFGQFLERENPSRFTWLRGFRDMDARATVNAAFYYGPLWKEHRTTMNDILVDSDNVLLLRPLRPGSGVAVLPAVDPVKEKVGAQGIVIAQIFALQADGVEVFAAQAETTLARYRGAGVREAGLLVTLDAPNNFPQLPVRTDGPYLVWLGIAADEAMLAQFNRLAQDAQPAFAATGLLRDTPELVTMAPTRRSRLRWLPE